MKKIALLTLIIALHATVLLAAGWRRGPEVTFTGRVFDDQTSRPLAGVQVSLDLTRRTVLTDERGAYRMVVPRAEIPGSPHLLARKVGYAPTRVPVDVTLDAVAADLWLGTEPLAADAQQSTAAPVVRAPMNDITIGEVTMESASVSGFAPPPPPPAHGLTPEPWNTENYAYIEENGFRGVDQHPLSTLSIDVDRASYSNVRRFIDDGIRPPRDAVRIEEMINYFPYRYQTGKGDQPFGVTTEVAKAPWQPEHLILRVGIASQAIETANLPASNLVFLLDVSGSMQSPDKLPLVKESMRMLVEQLRARDRVAMVVYAGAAGVVLPPTPGNDKETILAAIERLEAGGSTAGGEGLRLAYRLARESHIVGGNNRIILASDGDFNVGVSSDAEMIRLVEERRAQGTYLTVLGFGTGNLKDSRMEQMADHGNGNYAYVDSRLEARKVLVSEMGATLVTVAKDVKFQVEFNPAQVRAYRLIGYENRLLNPEDFNDDGKDAGELGAGHTVTALYEVVPVGSTSEVHGGQVDSLRYGNSRRTPRSSDELAFVRIRYKSPNADRSQLIEHPVAARTANASEDMRFATAVAGFGMLLRESEFAGSLTIADVENLARQGRGEDSGGYRSDFIRMVDAYQRIPLARAN